MSTTLRAAFGRLVLDDEGQDLVEYALLTATVGIAGVTVFALLRSNMAQAYDSWTNPLTPGSVQYNWEPLPPGGD